MGRYYDGDIEGKFWFGVQASDAPERFGCKYKGEDEAIIKYYIDKESIEMVKEEIATIEKNLGKYKILLDSFFDTSNGYNYEMIQEALKISKTKVRELLVEYADLKLGNQILQCLIVNGFCNIEAEF